MEDMFKQIEVLLSEVSKNQLSVGCAFKVALGCGSFNELVYEPTKNLDWDETLIWLIAG